MKFQVPAMLASGGGAIVNMASIAGLNGTANLAAYVAGKAGIIGLTKVAALDYADRGIRVKRGRAGTDPVDGGQAAGNKPPQMYRQGQPMSARGCHVDTRRPPGPSADHESNARALRTSLHGL
jgi:NAD(P)-dependent dehydrogenase (short-subunit alcohol dehydrogenase family)